MRKFLEHNRYNVVLYSLIAVGAVVVHQLSHAGAEKVWKSTLPFFEE